MRRILVFSLLAFNSIVFYAQEEKIPEGWDKILLEGKIAYMNLVTGDVSTTLPKHPARKPVKVKEFDPTIVHKVEKGETLSTIARKYRMPLADLYRLNSMTDFDKIEIGDEIVIGYKGKNGSRIVNVDNVKNTGFHIVKSGETLFRISRNYGISVTKLKTINNLKSNNIFVGQKLRVE
jgi:LysM repeat protein